MSEHTSQAAFIEWLSYQKFEGKETLHAIPNGGLRDVRVARKLKAEGQKNGIPDIEWPHPRGGFVGLAIEFKHGDGTPSAEQRRMIDAYQRDGWLATICWSWEAAARTVKGYAGLLKLEVL